MAEPRRLRDLSDEVRSLATLPEGPLLVALSGGADSAALLWICRRMDRTVRAVHVHHGLAGSDSMATAAGAVAAHVGVELTTIEVELGSGPSPENQARISRYRALAEAIRPGEWILTAHTLDDQAETVVDHLLRASGLDGLRGIPERRAPFARPLLAVRRSTTRELATLAGLAWRDDPANADVRFLRNRIRRYLIPELEGDFNPRLSESLATTAGLVARDVGYLEAQVDRIPIQVTAGGAELAATALSTAPAAVAARAVRRLLAGAGLVSAPPGAVDAVLEVAAGRTARVGPGAGLTVRRRGPMLLAERSARQPPAPVDLSVPGTTRFGPWSLHAFLSSAGPAAMPLGQATMVADADAIGRLRVEPAGGHPAVAAYLAEAGVAAPDRGAHPVVVGPDGPVWIPMVRRLPSGWVGLGTARYLLVQCKLDRADVPGEDPHLR